MSNAANQLVQLMPEGFEAAAGSNIFDYIPGYIFQDAQPLAYPVYIGVNGTQNSRMHCYSSP
jgi:hypothetical protein